MVGRKVLYIFLGVAAVLAAVAVFGLKEGRLLAQRPLTIVIDDWAGDQAIALVSLLGTDEEYGFNLDVRRTASAEDRVAPFKRGETDVLVGSLQTILSHADTEDLRIIYAIDASYGADGVIARDDIRSVADMRNRRIGVETGFADHFLIIQMLREAGLTTDDVTFVDVQMDEAEAVLRDGRVDVLATFAPYLTDLPRAVPGYQVLATTREYPHVIVDVIAVRTDALQANRERYVKLVQALDATIRRCHDAFESCLSALADHTGRTVQDWQSDFTGLRLLDIEDNRRLFSDNQPGGLATTLLNTREFVNRHLSEGVTADVTRWVDGSIIEDAARLKSDS